MGQRETSATSNQHDRMSGQVGRKSHLATNLERQGVRGRAGERGERTLNRRIIRRGHGLEDVVDHVCRSAQQRVALHDKLNKNDTENVKSFVRCP